MSVVKTITIDEIRHIITPPERACAYVSDIFDSKKIKPYSSGKALGVSPSTVKRFLDDGSLTTNMAAKLYYKFGVDPETLFIIEAKANAYKAMQMVKNRLSTKI